MSLPNDGEINLRIIPEKRYHVITANGPVHPISSASFLEKSIISRVGFVKLEYMVERELAHF